MNIVFFSTSAINFEKEKLNVRQFPSCKESFDKIAERFCEHNFFCVTQKPGDFLIDLEEGHFVNKCKKVTYIIDKGISALETADAICSCKPDLVIEAGFWAVPFDWLCIKNAMVSDILKERNIKVIAHSVKGAMICFSKEKTHETLKRLSVNTADYVYVNHQLFWCAGSKGKVRENVYKDAVLHQIKKLKFPVVIKDTTGLSSYGMEVCKNFEEVRQYLSSKRNNSDRLVETLIKGQQFGCEVYVCNGKINVFNPLEFSVNKYGITSPKFSIKKGPVFDKKYNLSELKIILEKIASELELDGVFQVDLVFAEGKWFVIEINPRLSGMSWTYAAALKKSPVELLLENALGILSFDKMDFALNFKLPLLQKSLVEKLSLEKDVSYVHQVENLNARQEREKGYLEVVLAGESLERLEEKYKILKEKFEQGE